MRRSSAGPKLWVALYSQVSISFSYLRKGDRFAYQLDGGHQSQRGKNRRALEYKQPGTSFLVAKGKEFLSLDRT